MKLKQGEKSKGKSQYEKEKHSETGATQNCEYTHSEETTF